MFVLIVGVKLRRMEDVHKCIVACAGILGAGLVDFQMIIGFILFRMMDHFANSLIILFLALKRCLDVTKKFIGLSKL